MPRLIDLDDPRGGDVTLTGAKAAALARARAHGLPVLPGVVVPVDAGAAVFGRAVSALKAGGSGAARLAILGSALEASLLRELEQRAGELGGPLIVRSSSPLESAGDWAGAFSTFHDVAAGELGTAVRGCWSSAFSVDALGRAEAAGLAPDELRLGVLVQPQLVCEAGGIARTRPGGAVEVVGVAGEPAALLGGWEPGVRALVGADGAVEDGTATRAIGAATVRAVAEVTARAFALTGHDRVEWARSPRGVTLLQLQRTPPPPATVPPPPPHPALRSATALRVARAAHRWAGPVGEEHVLPWGLALAGPPAATGPVSARPREDWEVAHALSRDLTARLWWSPEEAHAVLAALRGPEPATALARIEALPDLAAPGAERALRLFSGVGAALAARGVLGSPEDLWRCTPATVEHLVANGSGGAGPPRQPVTRWEPFVHAVVRAQGVTVEGFPATAGVGAGTVCFVKNPHARPAPRTRPVLVADRPLPGLAPLLWTAAGLVIGSSNPAAHLLEVAHSVGVPTVVGIDVGRLTGALDGSAGLAAVDGNTGTVAVLDDGPAPGGGPHRSV